MAQCMASFVSLLQPGGDEAGARFSGSVLIWTLVLVSIFVIRVFYSHKSTLTRLKSSTEVGHSIDSKIVDVANPSKNVEKGSFGGKIKRLGLIRSQRRLPAKNPNVRLPSHQEFIRLNSFVSFIRAIHWESFFANVGLTDNFPDGRPRSPCIYDVKLTCRKRAFFYPILDAIQTSNAANFRKIEVADGNRWAVRMNEGLLQHAGLFLDGTQRPVEEQNLQKPNNDQQTAENPNSPINPISVYRHGREFSDLYGILCILLALPFSIPFGGRG